MINCKRDELFAGLLAFQINCFGILFILACYVYSNYAFVVHSYLFLFSNSVVHSFFICGRLIWRINLAVKFDCVWVLDPELNTDTMKRRNVPTITTYLPFHRHLLFSFFLSLENQQFSFLFFLWILGFGRYISLGFSIQFLFSPLVYQHPSNCSIK